MSSAPSGSFTPSVSNRWGLLRWALVGLLLLAWALRLPPLLQTPLHPDEALYGYWGLLIGRGRDPWLATVPVYKPPLWPYVVALFQLLLGDTAMALRLPGLMAGLLTVPLVGALAQALYRDVGTGVGATAAAALSPFAVILSGTAFPDPLTVALGVGACLAAARGRLGWSGLLVGLSFVTKQTGLIWLPLALAVALLRGLEPGLWLRAFAVAFLAPIVLAFAWDAVRVTQGADSFWSAGVVGYGGLRLIWSHELWPRLRAWAGPMSSLFGSPLVNALLLVGLPFLIWRGLFRHPGTRRALCDLILLSFSAAYLLLHWLVAFPVWARYLLPLAPVLAVLLGRIAQLASFSWAAVLDRRALPVAGPVHSRPSVGRVCYPTAARRASRPTAESPGEPSPSRFVTAVHRLHYPMIAALLLALLLVVPAYQASAGRSPLAEDRAAYDGIDDVVSFLGRLPEGSVVYHHWLGWHYHYALFDGPVYLAYWPTPAWLARDVQAFGGRDPRYIAFPGWESPLRVMQALDEVGYALEPVLELARGAGEPSFVVYHVVPSPAP